MAEEKVHWCFYLSTRKNGYQYVIASQSKWVPELQQPRIVKRQYVGRLLDDLTVRMTENFLTVFPEYRGREICYRDNRLFDKSDLENDADYQRHMENLCAEEEAKKAEPALDPTESKEDDGPASLNCGRSWAAWCQMKLAGILPALEDVFGPDVATQLAQLAVYIFSTKNDSMQCFEEWAECNYIPGMKPLTSQRISELLALVDNHKIDEFFKIRHEARLTEAKKTREEELKKHPELTDKKLLPPLQLAFDSTSISTYSKTIENAEFGHNKQAESLAQINLTAVCDQASGEILYAHEYQGSINDVASFTPIIDRMLDAKFDLSETVLVADRGYKSQYNIQNLVDKNIRFVFACPLGKDNSLQVLFKRHKQKLHEYSYVMSDYGIFAYTPNEKAEWEIWKQALPNGAGSVDHRLFVHLYRNPNLEQRKALDLRMTIDTFLKFKDDEETKDQPVPQDLWAEVKPYVLQAKDGKWCVKWRKLNATCEKMGYFCIRTNCALSAQQSFELYRERGKIEEAFRRFKVTNNCDRLYSTEKTYRGKLFLFLLAESIRCIFGTTARTKCKAAGSKLPGNSLDKLLGKLDGVMLRRKGRGGHIWTPTLISKKQRDAFELLGIPTPAGRMPL